MKQKIKSLLIVFVILASGYSYAQALSYKQILPKGKVLGDFTVNNSNTYPSGSLVNDGGTIYFISGKIKIPFTTWSAFTGLGYKISNVQNGDLSNYTPAQSYTINNPNAPHPWGQFISYRGTIYYAHESGLIGVPNLETFLTNGGNLPWVVPANRFDISDMVDKGQQPLLQIGDPRIYGLQELANLPLTPTPTITPTPIPTLTFTYFYPTPTPTPLASTTPTPILLPTPTPEIATPSGAAPTIISLSPATGPAGTIVSVIGTNFTATGNTVYFRGNTSNSSTINNLSSQDGSTLTFTIPLQPNATTVMCVPVGGGSCHFTTSPGNYNVSITNSNGTTNSVQFIVTN